MTRCAAIVLAAGASRRMGRNKLVLDVGGVSLLRRTVERVLAVGVAPVIVVTGYQPAVTEQALAGLAVCFAHNDQPDGPMSDSVHVGLRALPGDVDAVLLVLADMPHVTTEMLVALRSAAERTPAPLVVSRYGDVMAPPHLFRRALFADLLTWHGEGGGRGVIQQHKDAAAILDWTAAALADVDTPDDYAALLTAARVPGP